METLKIGLLVKCRITGRSYKIMSIKGSWVELSNPLNRKTFFISTHKVLESYV